MSLILCPICQLPVISQKQQAIEEEEGYFSLDNYSCPTRTYMKESNYYDSHYRCWVSHIRFDGNAEKGTKIYNCQAILPPIQIIWRGIQNTLEVYDYHDFLETTSRLDMEPLEERTGGFDEFLAMIERFKNLKAFL